MRSVHSGKLNKINNLGIWYLKILLKYLLKYSIEEFRCCFFILFYSYLIRSGSLKHVNDKITNAVLEILPESQTQNGSFILIDTFDEFGMVEGQVSLIIYLSLL